MIEWNAFCPVCHREFDDYDRMMVGAKVFTHVQNLHLNDRLTLNECLSLVKVKPAEEKVEVRSQKSEVRNPTQTGELA